MRFQVTAETLVNPTEDEAKVARALQNIFPSAPITRLEESDGSATLQVCGEGFEFLRTLRNRLKEGRIRSAARSILTSRTQGNRIRFYLNKQAAHAGHVSFCEPIRESPLGSIKVEIEADDAQSVIDLLAPNVAEKTFKRFKKEA